MRRPGWITSLRQPQAAAAAPAGGSLRDRLALLLAVVTAAGAGAAFFVSKGTQFLMPGPLASAHGAIEKCSTCHTASGSGKMSWVHGLVAGDPRADSKACLTCHKMPDTAFNAHGTSAEVLEESTKRLTKIAASIPSPQSARAQNNAFPAHDVAAGGLTCATCHQEHQGVNFKLSKISNEQCRSCHVVKFDSFDGHHPNFDNYPFKQRSRIIYDHAGHFGKHYPEVAKKDPLKRIPETCASCHNSRDDKRIMAIAPFDQTCSTCHLDQITGKARVSGPKGIAFLSLPGLDLETLKKNKAAIGEWPDGSEALLTPFMKVMISRTDEGRALLKAIDGMNLQDLSSATEDQIKTVTRLAWEIKRLLYALISGKASDTLAGLTIGSGAQLSAPLVADLTASIPREVVISAQQQWLPNLASEIANGPIESTTGQSAAEPAPAEDVVKPDANEPVAEGSPLPEAGEERKEEPKTAKRDPPACLVRVLGQCLMFKRQGENATAGEPAPAVGFTENGNPKPSNDKNSSAADPFPQPMRAGLQDVAKAALAEAAAAKPDGGKTIRVAENQPPPKAGEQTDDLLVLTDEEQRALKARVKDTGKGDTGTAAPGGAVSAPAAATTSAEKAQTPAAPEISIASGVDAESWAEYGGWYSQDHAIYYRPAGHKDKFVYSWLYLTGPQAPKGDASPAAAVFDNLSGKDAQGSCTKCHSIDDIQGKGRLVNFSPASMKTKQGRFTRFIHEPHFGVIGNRGCLTCHNLKSGQPYLKSYEQTDPHTFTPEFSAVKKDQCKSCHTSTMARQDCLLCHKYHVNDVMTPITNTKLPMQSRPQSQ